MRSMARGIFLFIDLEMTGVRDLTDSGMPDIETDRIMQVAAIVTTKHLDILAKTSSVIAFDSAESLSALLSPWSAHQHTQSKDGMPSLFDQCLSDEAVTIEEAERRVLAIVTPHLRENQKVKCAGNSVHVDLQFIKRYMPRLAQHIGHSVLDVSSILEATTSWSHNVASLIPRNTSNHTAMADIESSLALARFFYNEVFKVADSYARLNTTWDVTFDAQS